MLDILNVIFLSSTLISQTINIVVIADYDIKKQGNTKVYAISMTQQAPVFVEKCQYSGVMVQYARDWQEVHKKTGEVFPSEPEKPIGYALILTKEKCPNKEEHQIFSTASKFFYPFFGKEYVIREGSRMDAVDYTNQSENFRPKWMPQVLNTIREEASQNPVAESFIAELKNDINAALLHK